MCGIAGIVNFTNTAAEPSGIRRMCDAMAHRGPDADGFYVEGPVALGHRRLSIIDLSTAANQPFIDNSGRYVIVFNGEMYNYEEVKAMLPDYAFRTSGDTEVLLAAYIKWGADCLQYFRGMFAFFVWDKETKEIFIARDRMGVKPLYYYMDGERLLFASEIRSILASGLVPRTINRAAIADFLKYQSFVAPYTPVENIFQVPAGTFMTYKNGRLEEKVYWSLAGQKREIDAGDKATVHKSIRDLLFQSIERRLVSDVPLGAFLSGGIDSSLVVAIMSQINRKATNAFTIAFEEKEYNELPYAETVARKFGVNHSKVMLKPSDFLDRLPDALDAMDSPSGDGLNIYVVSKAIKQNGITVALSGIGGDELFAGYPFFRRFYDLQKRKGIFDHTLALRRMAAAFLPVSDQKMGRIKGLLRADSSDIADIYPSFRQIQDGFTMRKLMAKGVFSNGEGSTLEAQLRSQREAIGKFDPLSQVSIAEYMGYTQSVLLKDGDQMGMAASLEIREPFFDHDLIEYVLNVPDRFKYPTYPKQLLVESLAGLLPDEIIFRKKQGFVIPYDLWMRNELKQFCEEKIRRLASRDFFREEELLKYWNNYLLGNSNIRSTDIWIFIVLEHWLEKNGF